MDELIYHPCYTIYSDSEVIAEVDTTETDRYPLPGYTVLLYQNGWLTGRHGFMDYKEACNCADDHASRLL